MPSAFRDEKGAALITVLCFVVLIAMVTASAVTVSQICNYTSRTLTDRSISAYLAEGAAARVQWLIMADKKKFSSRLLGETEYARETQERFLADGTLHKIDYYGTEIDVTIYDMASGYDISDDNPAKQLETQKSTFTDDNELKDAFNTFIDCVKDYVDKDDFVQLKGMEKSAYTAKGLYPLPRNGRMQFREEIMLIPGFERFYQPDSYGRLSSFRVIPPLNMPKIGQNNDFFSASREQIMSRCGFSSEQADKVIEARNRWKSDRIPLSQTLDLGLLSTLKGRFSFKESGFFTILVEASPGKNRARRILAASMQIGNQITPPGTRYYEWVSY
jgi:type II secretory pathway component PulK